MIADINQPTGPTIKRGKSKQDYSTPKEFLDAVRARFGSIDADLAASAANAVSPAFYDVAKEDSLTRAWNELGGWLWLNPPFNNIEPWAAKCAAESALGARILFLTPASVGSNWFQQWVYPSANVLMLNPRISFDGKNAFPKDLILSVFSGGMRGMQPWRWK